MDPEESGGVFCTLKHCPRRLGDCIAKAEAFLDIFGMDTFDNWDTNTMFPGRKKML